LSTLGLQGIFRGLTTSKPLIAIAITNQRRNGLTIWAIEPFIKAGDLEADQDCHVQRQVW
jgi:hypothetical protein